MFGLAAFLSIAIHAGSGFTYRSGQIQLKAIPVPEIESYWADEATR